MQHQNQKPEAIARARRLRKEMSYSEEVLWERLRDGRTGLKIRHGFPIGGYCLDFYCAKARLCIEVDGQIHVRRKERDEKRDAFLLLRSIATLRFSSEECLYDTERVVREIVRECQARIDAGFGCFSKRTGRTADIENSPPT